MRPINVLLLLSSKQLPHPTNEIDALIEEADKSDLGITHFVTTRAVGDRLTPGKSVVALYGDKELEFDLLATGLFVDFIPRYDTRWNAIIDRHPVYSHSEVPQTAIGMIEIEDIQLARKEGLEVLNAIREDGKRVTTELIKELHAVSEHDVFGTYASSIYFVAGANPSDSERIELLLAKKDELEKKTADFAARWRESEDYRTKIRKDMSDAAKKFRPILEGLGEPSLGVSIAAAIGDRSDKGLLSMYRLAASIASEKLSTIG